MKLREYISFLQAVADADAQDNPFGPDLDIFPPDLDVYAGKEVYANVGKDGWCKDETV